MQLCVALYFLALFLLLLFLQVLTTFQKWFSHNTLYQSLGYMESRTQTAELDYRKLMK